MTQGQDREPQIGDWARFHQWLEAALLGVDARVGKVRRIGGLPAMAPSSGVPAGCVQPPVRQEAPQGSIRVGGPSLGTEPQGTVSDQARAHLVFKGATETGDPEVIARAWMALRAVDPDGIAQNERSTGNQALRTWGAQLVSGGTR